MKYSHNNGQLTINDLNKEVFLRGWVAKKRNLGGLIFIDLRDMHGITQLVIDPSQANYQLALSLRNEYVIEVNGKVIERQSKNPNLKTGEIEIEVSNLNLLNKAETTPLIIADETDALEEVRLKYRYLDLRRPSQKNYLLARSKIVSSIRKTLEDKGFLELETPILSKSTPEGARDYLVPSRLYPNEFYALPQSPQIYKQLYMVAGFENYFQIAKCFRDEDLRADRQPEFTQVDIEASFVDQKDIIEIGEEIFTMLFKDVLNIEIKRPFLIMDYQKAIDSYGSDKPDIRFELLLKDYNYLLSESIPLFENEQTLKGIKVKNATSITRKKIDSYTELVKKNHGKALAFLRFDGSELTGSIKKFITKELEGKLNLAKDELLFLVPGSYKDVTKSLGALRIEIAKDLNLIDPNQYSFLWVVDWPLLEYDEENQRYVAMHHPFTSPKDINILKTNPGQALAKAYDLVLNGQEIGGGSIRIHNVEVQNLMFETIGLNKTEINERFGFLLEAFKYGTPPHGGIAFGLDRIVMIMTKTNNIKDVIAFPKTQTAKDLMNDSPSQVDPIQLKELSIEVKKHEKK